MVRRRLARVAAITTLMLVGGWSARAFWLNHQLPVAEALVVSHAYEFRTDTLRRNETLSHLFARHGIAGQDLLSFLEVADPINPRRTRAGQTFTFRRLPHTERAHLVESRLGDVIFTAVRDGAGGWSASTEEVTWEARVVRASGTVTRTVEQTVQAMLHDSVLPARERGRLTANIADGVFGWVVDFTRDIYPNDKIAVVFEREVSSMGDVRLGRILAVHLETRGTPLQAFLFPDGSGRTMYYDEEGQSLRRAFKRYPVDYARMTSSFSRRRFHPVLQRYRAHLGVDYSAPTGTPIKATGDGTIARAGEWGGYGRMVAIRHARNIETRYAHMSRIARGIRPGVRVTQGQVIGYSGMSGLATAPHVHYEFIRGGSHVDPRTAVRYQMGDPVPRARRGEFLAVRDRLTNVLFPDLEATAAADGD